MVTTPSRIDVRVRELNHSEAPAAGAITPGHLVRINSAGKAAVHNVADGFGETKFAAADLFSGRNIDQAYAADETVSIIDAVRHDVILAILADSQTIVIGDQLASAGDGTLRKAGGSTKQVVAYAKEAVTTSGATKRIQVEVA